MGRGGRHWWGKDRGALLACQGPGKTSCDGSWASVQRGLGVLRCSCGEGDAVDLEAITLQESWSQD